MSRHFTSDKITLNKKEVRERLYDDVHDLLPRAKIFGMLAGEVPGEEIGVIRRRFYRPDITAFDLNPRGVEAANECGVTAVRGNLVYEKTIAGRRFDFFDLDLCKTLVTSRKLIQKIALKTDRALAVFISYRDGAEASAKALEVSRESQVMDVETTEECERVSAVETTKRCERVMMTETANEQERVIVGKTTKKVERVRVLETTERQERISDQETTTLRERVSPQETTIAIKRVRNLETTIGVKRVTVVKSPIPDERVMSAETPKLRERVTCPETTTAHERVSGRKTTDGEKRVIRTETTKIGERLTGAQNGRVILTHQCVFEARPDAQIVRVYAYRGNAGMMLGVLFAFGKKPIEQLPPFCTVSEEASFERHHRLRMLGVGGKQLHTRLKNGQREAKRKHQGT